MARYHLYNIAQLARQLEFAPQDVRLAQLARAEDLLHLVDPSKGYPLDFVTYRITDYRPKNGNSELLTGLALQHDLGLLIEQVSDTLDILTNSVPEPVLTIEHVCARFDVTSKTIQRWRRRGLPARRFLFSDGKRRVGFLLSSVERFLSRQSPQTTAESQQANHGSSDQDHLITRHARRLAVACHCGLEQLSRRIARLVNRSPMAILHILRKHDQEHPSRAILPLLAKPIPEAQRLPVLKAWQSGATLADLASQLGVSRSEVYHLVLGGRIAQVVTHNIHFHDDPLFHQPDAATVIQALQDQQELPQSPQTEDLRVPRDLPAPFQALYRAPLLTKATERALFLKLNFHKFQFAQARQRLEPEMARKRDLDRMEAHLANALATKNQILQANLRLVASVARRHLRPGITLSELLSDGVLTLMRAVDSFDIAKGFRFSTYGTLALMKGFARSVPQMRMAGNIKQGNDELMQAVADCRPSPAQTELADREQLGMLLSRLDERERGIVEAHYGLGQRGAPATYEQLAEQMGLSKERVRQIEQSALAKLRADAARDGQPALG